MKKFHSKTEVLKADTLCRFRIYRYVVKSEKRTTIFHFRPNQNFFEFSWTNGWGSNKIMFQDNKIYCVQNGNRKIESWREFTLSDMVMTISCDGHFAKRFFRAVDQDNSCVDQKECCVYTTDNQNNFV